MDEIVYYDGLGENVIVNGPCCSHLSARPCASGKEFVDKELTSCRQTLNFLLIINGLLVMI